MGISVDPKPNMMDLDHGLNLKAVTPLFSYSFSSYNSKRDENTTALRSMLQLATKLENPNISLHIKKIIHIQEPALE